MLCNFCHGKVDNCTHGTEKIEVCINCGIITKDTIDPENIDLHLATSYYSHLYFTTPSQKLSLSKIDGLIEKLNMVATKQKCHDLISE